MTNVVPRRTVGRTQVTLALSALMAGAAAALVTRLPAEPVIGGPVSRLPWTVIAGVLFVTFVLAQTAELHVEFRRQAFTFSITGLPLLVAVLLVDPRVVVAARLAGSVVALAVQRRGGIKATYNTCAYALEAALVAYWAHRLLPAGTLDIPSAGRVWLLVLAVDLLMSVLVLAMIRFHHGAMTGRQVLEILAPAVLLSVASTLLALLSVLVAQQGPLGWALLGLVFAGVVAAQRAYARLHRRHRALLVLHDFVADVGTPGGEEPGRRALLYLRSALNARYAEITWQDGTTVRRLTLADDDAPYEPGPLERTAGEDVTAVVGADSGAVLFGRGTRSPAVRAALARAGWSDAIVVPLRHDHREIGRLVIGERQSDVSGWTREDVSLVQTLAAHVAMALHDAGLLRRLRHQATHDGLTGLGNRALLEERLAALDDDRPEGPGWASVLLLDVNRFKDVNDTLGHASGDQLLGVVAERLRAVLPEAALISRLGGDEFAVLLDDVRDPADAATAAKVAVEALREPVDLDDVTVSADACVGVAVAGLREGRARDLLRQADLAMYDGKSAGRPVTVYSRELERGQTERLALVADLQLALARHELEVAYQPKLDLRDLADGGGLHSVEALVRWNHPRLGPLAPDVFVPLAESTGLVHELTRQVLDTALDQARRWAAQGLPVGVAVNLSVRNLGDPHLPETVAAALARTGVPPWLLTLEITESSVMTNPTATLPVLQRLADLGVLLSLDDFGTGYSSLSYLQVLPVREVKIDRSFVQPLSGEGPRHPSHILVRAILSLAHDLGMRVVAEGVEDVATLDLLRRLGCETAQGYHIGRPTTAERVTAMIRRQAGVGAQLPGAAGTAS